MSYSFTIFDFKPKKERVVRVPESYQLNTATLALWLVTTLALLFQSPVKKAPVKPKKPLNPLKITKPIKPVAVVKGRGVRKQVAKTTVEKSKGKGGG
jgi:hypothetical protein